MIGKIIKGIGGFYSVKSGGELYTLKARGRFRIRGGKPIVGDEVEFSPGGGMIERILERKNEFIRPAVSNMTQVGVVFAIRHPSPDLLLVDQMLVQAQAAGIGIFVVLGKCELASSEQIQAFADQYRLYDFLPCSTYANIGIDAFKAKLTGQDTFLSGQSGVGKSSLVNCAFPGFGAPIGEVSPKLERGRHTTRHVEICPLPGEGGSIVDTPGFSRFEIPLESIDIQSTYREFEPFGSQCRFVGCSHTHEPGCQVKSRVGGEINEKRYRRYCVLMSDQQERRKRQYD